MWGTVGLLATLHMINSDAEGYNPFLQTYIQLILQGGYPATFAFLQQGRKVSLGTFMTWTHLPSKHKPS